MGVGANIKVNLPYLLSYKRLQVTRCILQLAKYFFFFLRINTVLLFYVKAQDVIGEN
jgi:hypothetical protein